MKYPQAFVATNVSNLRDCGSINCILLPTTNDPDCAVSMISELSGSCQKVPLGLDTLLSPTD